MTSMKPGESDGQGESVMRDAWSAETPFPVAPTSVDDREIPDVSAPLTEAQLPGYAQRGPSLRVRSQSWLHAHARTLVPRDIPSIWAGNREWILPLAVVIVAALLRFVGLGHPHSLVFDETYYVKDAWTLAHLGYEGSWPEDPNPRFEAGETMIFTEAGSRVVHPPLGKWLIALPMLVFGADSAVGWRFATALFGTLTVLVTYLLARRLTGSAWWAAIAGLFLAVDGLSIVMSRVSLLDGILTFFIMLGTLFIVFDHRGTMARIARSTDAFIGPVMWRRPWVIAAGIAFGCAAGVKWSGFYALAGFGIYLVVSDALARKRAGVQMWGSAAVGRQGPASFILLVAPAMAVYVATWTGWLITQGGYKRDSDANPFIALVNYHLDSLSFHVGLTSVHAYASPAWQWPFLIRPTSMFWNSDTCGTGEGSYNCVQAITAIPNPLLWWAGVIAIGALIYGLIRFRDWRYAIVLVGFATSYVPWLLVPERTIFQFYTVVMMPFMMLALVLMLQRLTSGNDPRGAADRRAWRISTGVFLVLVIAASLFFLPVWTGMQVPYPFWQIHMWIPSWV